MFLFHRKRNAKSSPCLDIHMTEALMTTYEIIMRARKESFIAMEKKNNNQLSWWGIATLSTMLKLSFKVMGGLISL